MTLQEALSYGFEKLKKVGIDSYQLDTELLLSKALFHPGKPTEREFLKYVEKIRKDHLYRIKKTQKLQKHNFTKLVTKRTKRIPVAYLTNIKYFFGLPFYVDNHVLIPRPQTEVLVGRAMQDIEISKYRNIESTIIDIGTGSGCIIVSLAKTLCRRGTTCCAPTYIGTDTSTEALDIARMNARIHGVKNHIKFIKTKKLPVIKTKSLLVVANLPYLDPALKTKLITKTPELRYEPQQALFASNRGLEHYQNLIQQLKLYQKKHINVTCFFEIDPHQYSTLSKYTQHMLGCRALHQNGVLNFSLLTRISFGKPLLRQAICYD